MSATVCYVGWRAKVTSPRISTVLHASARGQVLRYGFQNVVMENMVSDVPLHSLLHHRGNVLRISLCRGHPPACFVCALPVVGLLGLGQALGWRRRYILRLPAMQGSSARRPAS